MVPGRGALPVFCDAIHKAQHIGTDVHMARKGDKQSRVPTKTMR